jgi:hypothetical protein
MADLEGKKISAMTPATLPLVGTELIPGVQSGGNVKMSPNDILSIINNLAFSGLNTTDKHVLTAINELLTTIRTKADINPTTGATSALTALFVARGYGDVIYNATTNKFEMFGITDIGLAEMMEIYNISSVLYQNDFTSIFAKYKGITCRTIYRIPVINSSQYTTQLMFMENTYIQIVQTDRAVGIYPPQIQYAGGMFYGCTALVKAGYWSVRNATISSMLDYFVYGCVNLEELFLFSICVNFSFSDCQKIKLECLQYLVANRNNGTSRITITVHPTVWAKLNDAVGYPTWNALLVDAVNNNYIDFASA